MDACAVLPCMASAREGDKQEDLPTLADPCMPYSCNGNAEGESPKGASIIYFGVL